MNKKTVYTRLRLITEPKIKIQNLQYSVYLIHPKGGIQHIIKENRTKLFDNNLTTAEHSLPIQRPQKGTKHIGIGAYPIPVYMTDKEFEQYLLEYKAVFTIYLEDKEVFKVMGVPVFLKKGETTNRLWKLSQGITQQAKTIEKKNFGCSHGNGAIVVAKYIAEEMVKNISHPVTVKLRTWNMLASTLPYKKLNAYILFQKQIGYGKPWDHKTPIASGAAFRKASLYGSTRHEALFHRYGKFDYAHDVWSNIHYGFIGRVCGFSELELSYGAGLAQLSNDYETIGKTWDRLVTLDAKQWDNPEDQITIALGYSLYNEFEKNRRKPTAERILALLDAADFSKIKAQKNKTEHSKNCQNGTWNEPKSDKG